MTTDKTQKLSRAGSGAYSIRVPPTSNASARPSDWAAVVTEPARFDWPAGLNSTSAAAEGEAESPTPIPMKARPTNSQSTEGATAKSKTPRNEAVSPSSMVFRRPI